MSARRIQTLLIAPTLLSAACSGSDAVAPSPRPSASITNPASAATTPTARAYAVMADAPGDTGVVLFGGQFGVPPGTPLSDLWAFGPDTGWIQLDPETGHGTDAFAYDSNSKLLVSVEETETWTYDLVSGRWRVLETGGHPRDVWGARVAYDSGSRRVILFGGFDGSTLNDQTWALDLEGQTWERMHPPTSPPAQNFHTMAYDSVADRVILFSGHGHQGTWAYDYVWLFDPATNSWSHIA